MSELVIKDLWVSASGTMILKGINLTINSVDTIALMGPNGGGKSTLAYTIMGHPDYKVEKGFITFDGIDLLSLSVDERSRKGIFLAMQSPYEISGVTNRDFIKQACDKRVSEDSKRENVFKFALRLDKAISDLDMDKDLADRYVNVDFSGGEKKKNEILQLKMLEPKFAILDEIDSGLDVDAVKVVSKNVNEVKEKNGLGLILISHYHRLFEYIKPTHAVVLINGMLVKEGGFELVDYIDKYGYEPIKREAGIEDEVTLLEDCAFKGNKQ